MLLVHREQRTIKKERIRALVEADPIFRRDDAYFNDRQTTYLRGLQKINRIQQRRRELRLDDEEQRLFKQYVGDALPVWARSCRPRHAGSQEVFADVRLAPVRGPCHQTFLHDNVFIPNLIGQMDDEQKAKWLKKAQDYEIIGCYAQTEVRHLSASQKA